MNIRNSERHEVQQAGTISFQGSAIGCMIYNISIGGANLEIDVDLKIPRFISPSDRTGVWQSPLSCRLAKCAADRRCFRLGAQFK